MRKTLGYSKKLEMLEASSIWEDVVYNVGRALKTLRIESRESRRHWNHRSPAMAAGLTDHIWEIEEILGALPLPSTNTLIGRLPVTETTKKDLLRSLPAVDAVLGNPAARLLAERYGWQVLAEAVREALEACRREILAGGEPGTSEEAVISAVKRTLSGRGLRRVVNATGVVLHTNLGRSVLSGKAAAAALEAATRYSNLEFDLASGSRGSRYDHAVPALCGLTGSEDALVVNNCAAATLLALSAIAAEAATDGEPEVIVSRGQLVEIGGGFRIPEVLELSGARLREVGTTNRTRLSDYERAMNESTCAILWVHPSNFHVSGFTGSVSVAELAGLGPPVVADVGSGALIPVGNEPLAREAVRDGAGVALFSGDKLLGGPQAGIAVGASRWISAMRLHPLARAVRADKLCLAALEATLAAYLEGRAEEELPTLQALLAPDDEVEERARKLARALSEKRAGAGGRRRAFGGPQRRRHPAGARVLLVRRASRRPGPRGACGKAAFRGPAGRREGPRRTAVAGRADATAGDVEAIAEAVRAIAG